MKSDSMLLWLAMFFAIGGCMDAEHKAQTYRQYLDGALERENALKLQLDVLRRQSPERTGEKLRLDVERREQLDQVPVQPTTPTQADRVA
jgi:hypothetical protein